MKAYSKKHIGGLCGYSCRCGEEAAATCDSVGRDDAASVGSAEG